MLYYSTVTQKSQITLPKALRQKIGVEPYEKVLLQFEHDYIKITPAEDILDLAGSYKVDKKKSPLNARKKMENGYSPI